MRRVMLQLAILTVLLAVGVALTTAQQNPQGAGAAPGGQGGPGGGAGRPGGGGPPPPLRLTSAGFADGTQLPAKYSCTAGPAAVSPPLRWANTPRDTVTFALIVHDMEPRPRKGVDDILHWMVWNIPASANGFPEGVPSGSADLPDGSRQTNGNAGNGGIVGYRPPCPPQDIPVPHHYAFELYALDEKVDLPAGASRADLLKAMDGHISAHAALIAPFNR